MVEKTDHISSYLSKQAAIINDTITQFLPKQNVPNILSESMEYSLLAGGKRVRPILTLATYEAFRKDPVEILPIAINIELLHTYSLIHDDLPAMDNDDYRRGKLTNHKVYGEAVAILTGDALLTHAFGNMAKYLKEMPHLSLDSALTILDEFAQYSGASGMVGGQTVDLLGEKGETSFEDLNYIHTHKTGDLIVFSVRLGAMLAGASAVQLDRLTEFARKIGFAFQIQDDILDVIGDSHKLGKKVGSDEENNKVTYPYFKGIDYSKQEVLRLTNEAKEALRTLDIDSERLIDIADYLIKREV